MYVRPNYPEVLFSLADSSAIVRPGKPVWKAAWQFVDTPLKLQRISPTEVARNERRWPLVFAILCGLTGVGFLLLPGSIEGKSLAALHGLCAQQPTHSFYFGDQRLPFDARMTGIYGGAALTALYMLARGRWRYGNVPSITVSAILASFILIMGVDGVNSTLRDMGFWYAYEPRNELRLATGMLTGTALAVFVWMMTAQVGFSNRARVRQSPIAGLRDLGLLLAIETATIGLILTGWSLLRVPLTVVLLVSAVVVVTGLTLAFVLLLGRRESRAVTTADLAGPATIALLIALALIGGLGGGRFLLEWWLGIEPVVRSAA